MMCAWLILFHPSHSSRVLSEIVGLVGGNPTMNTNTNNTNTPTRLRRVGRIASSSSFVASV